MTRLAFAGRSWRELARLGIQLVPGLAAGIAVAVDGLASGGYFPRTWRLTTIALAALAAAALLGNRRIVLARRDWAFLALLGRTLAERRVLRRWKSPSERVRNSA